MPTSTSTSSSELHPALAASEGEAGGRKQEGAERGRSVSLSSTFCTGTRKIVPPAVQYNHTRPPFAYELAEPSRISNFLYDKRIPAPLEISNVLYDKRIPRKNGREAGGRREKGNDVFVSTAARSPLQSPLLLPPAGAAIPQSRFYTTSAGNKTTRSMPTKTDNTQRTHTRMRSSTSNPPRLFPSSTHNTSRHETRGSQPQIIQSRARTYANSSRPGPAVIPQSRFCHDSQQQAQDRCSRKQWPHSPLA